MLVHATAWETTMQGQVQCPPGKHLLHTRAWFPGHQVHSRAQPPFNLLQTLQHEQARCPTGGKLDGVPPD